MFSQRTLWLCLAIFSGSKDMDFEWRDQWNIFLLPLHRIFGIDNVDLCSALGDFDTKYRKITNEIV